MSTTKESLHFDQVDGVYIEGSLLFKRIHRKRISQVYTNVDIAICETSPDKFWGRIIRISVLADNR